MGKLKCRQPETPHGIIERIERIKENIKEYAQEIDIPTVSHTVILGLGVLTSPVSQHQLALILSLSTYPIIAFDPVFNELDKAVLEHYGISVKHVNKGLMRVTEKTLFFMPHCDILLYNNLVYANMSTINNVVLIGNLFCNYDDKRLERFEYVKRSAQICEYSCLKEYSWRDCVFNNTAVQTFSGEIPYLGEPVEDQENREVW